MAQEENCQMRLYGFKWVIRLFWGRVKVVQQA
jgi:hypothetical protein